MPKLWWLCCAPLLTVSAASGAQQLPRAAYYDYLPPVSPIVAQRAASVRLRLYGDSSSREYRDLDPIDGIDDARAERLRLIAERFSPVMRRNNFSVPRDLNAAMGPVHYLQVDQWRRGRLVQSESIPMRDDDAGPTLAGASGNVQQITWSEKDDARLRDLIARTGPRAGRRAVTAAEGEVEETLYFDQPGSDLASWRRAYSRVSPKDSKVFVHPFIHEVSDSSLDELRYFLVMQYWFFYPFNDAVNTHEGDWEHINVIVTTKARIAAAGTKTFEHAALSASDLAALLAPAYPVGDSLVIGAVDYYFHQNVMTLDYVALLSDEQTLMRAPDARYVWEDVTFIRDVVRDRVAASNGRLATHPVVYIGGDNKGPDELLILRPRFLASFKRNSGSSYPFPGVWQTVAGFGVTEKVNGRPVPELRDPDTLAWYDAIDSHDYVTFRERDIILVPDWERVEPLITTEGAARRTWSWLLLPIYWGFPAMRSTGVGLLKHVDMGNIAPLGPAYQSGWNRVGTDPDYTRYDVRVLRTLISPTTPWAAVHNGWGVLNLPLATWGLMPGYNVALIEVMPWLAGTMSFFGAPPSRSYVPNRLPSRFTTAAQGAFMEFGGRALAGVLPRHDPRIPESGATSEVHHEHRANAGARLWFNLYFGERFSLENTYSVATSHVSYDLLNSSGESIPIAGVLSLHQLTGGVRYDVFRQRGGSLRMYTRAGYGWLSYRATGLTADAVPLTVAEVRGGYLPPLLPSSRWWPNTWYGGGGIEVFSPRRYFLFHLIGYGARVEATGLFNKLTFSEESGRGDVLARRGDLALSLVFGW